MCTLFCYKISKTINEELILSGGGGGGRWGSGSMLS